MREFITLSPKEAVVNAAHVLLSGWKAERKNDPASSIEGRILMNENLLLGSAIANSRCSRTL